MGLPDSPLRIAALLRRAAAKNIAPISGAMFFYVFGPAGASLGASGKPIGTNISIYTYKWHVPDLFH